MAMSTVAESSSSVPHSPASEVIGSGVEYGKDCSSPFTFVSVTAGAAESSTYVASAVEQLEVLPAASVAVAWNVVDELSATVTARPGVAKLVAVPVAATGLVQVLFV